MTGTQAAGLETFHSVWDISLSVKHKAENVGYFTGHSVKIISIVTVPERRVGLWGDVRRQRADISSLA